VEAWLARPKNALVSSTLFPTSKDKEEIKGYGVDKKRLGLERFFYRMRKKLKQKQEAEEADASVSVSDGPKAAD